MGEGNRGNQSGFEGGRLVVGESEILEKRSNGITGLRLREREGEREMNIVNGYYNNNYSYSEKMISGASEKGKTLGQSLTTPHSICGAGNGFLPLQVWGEWDVDQVEWDVDQVEWESDSVVSGMGPAETPPSRTSPPPASSPPPPPAPSSHPLPLPPSPLHSVTQYTQE